MVSVNKHMNLGRLKKVFFQFLTAKHNIIKKELFLVGENNWTNTAPNPTYETWKQKIPKEEFPKLICTIPNNEVKSLHKAQVWLQNKVSFRLKVETFVATDS